MVPTTKQADGISFWHVNVPPALRTTACPDFLLGLSDKDRTIIGTPDALYHPQTWEEVVSLVHANRLELFRRRPSDLRRYREFVHQVANQYGSVERFLLDTRLHWAAPLEPVGPAFESPEDIKLLRNDWPYGLDPKIVHLVVWTKFHLQEDPATEDLTNQARQQIEDFVERTFRSMMPKDTVIWFKNWAALKSVDGVEHIHVMLLDPPAGFVDQVTGGDVAMCNRAHDHLGVHDERTLFPNCSEARLRE